MNKQLNDKERVAAALENAQLLGVVERCIANSDPDTLLPDQQSSTASGSLGPRSLASNIAGTRAHPTFGLG